MKTPLKTPEEASIAILTRLGKRRQAHIAAGERLAADIRQALTLSDGFISKSDAAHLLGMDRSSMYRTYIKENQ